ncbi:MAG: glycerophosphodiester phosphodiesterase family protein [Ruminococcaceae bacterium]|nr:glycerophosphodiester phosphodiesterase family protein [Oscillospiraceae bacterium]
MDFTKNIFENRQQRKLPFLAAHRGICGGNIPCNTLASYEIALRQGADVVEIDVTRAKDGGLFVFHPGMEKIFLRSDRPISDMTTAEASELYLVNQDSTRTGYRVPTLFEVLTFLKGKTYINVDKFWTDVKGISDEIRRAGVEDQVIVKTGTDEKSLEAVAKYAPDFMFMPIVKTEDRVTAELISKGVNVIGIEAIFETEDAPVISDEYIKKMHDRGLLVWVNSIVYNEKAILSAGHTDDISLTKDPDLGWGWLIDKNIDFIQTDWLLSLKEYTEGRR